jgi:hypothetical protein
MKSVLVRHIGKRCEFPMLPKPGTLRVLNIASDNDTITDGGNTVPLCDLWIIRRQLLRLRLPCCQVKLSYLPTADVQCQHTVHQHMCLALNGLTLLGTNFPHLFYTETQIVSALR